MRDKFLKLQKQNSRIKKIYGVTTAEGLMFFEVHKGADVVHREECEKLLNDLTEAEQAKAEKRL